MCAAEIACYNIKACQMNELAPAIAPYTSLKRLSGLQGFNVKRRVNLPCDKYPLASHSRPGTAKLITTAAFTSAIASVLAMAMPFALLVVPRGASIPTTPISISRTMVAFPIRTTRSSCVSAIATLNLRHFIFVIFSYSRGKLSFGLLPVLIVAGWLLCFFRQFYKRLHVPEIQELRAACVNGRSKDCVTNQTSRRHPLPTWLDRQGCSYC